MRSGILVSYFFGLGLVFRLVRAGVAFEPGLEAMRLAVAGLTTGFIRSKSVNCQ